jgi:hypothetical protein
LHAPGVGLVLQTIRDLVSRHSTLVVLQVVGSVTEFASLGIKELRTIGDSVGNFVARVGAFVKVVFLLASVTLILVGHVKVAVLHWGNRFTPEHVKLHFLSIEQFGFTFETRVLEFIEGFTVFKSVG